MEIKVIVCGDSFCSASKHDKLHFSQILQNLYGYSVTNLARGGASAVNIAYQIQTAIKLSADVIIHGRTLFSRIDVPLRPKEFNPVNGLKNFVYSNSDELSYGSSHVGNVDSPIYSNNFGSLLPVALFKEKKQIIDIPSQIKSAVQHYVEFLHDENLASEIDNWIYEYWEDNIIKKNILSLRFDKVGQEAYNFYKKKPHYPAIYHTDSTTQQAIAHNIHDEIQKNLQTKQG
jgi:hypothetical protein